MIMESSHRIYQMMFPLITYKNLKMDYYEAHLVLDQRKRNEIEQSTRGQSMEQNWYVERRKRITVSKAGAVSKR